MYVCVVGVGRVTECIVSRSSISFLKPFLFVVILNIHTHSHTLLSLCRYYTCKLDGVQLYLLLDGHNGSRACDFARRRIPSLLLQRNMGEGGERAAEALQYTFENAEKQFFMMLDPSITQKMSLQIEIQVTHTHKT